MRLLIHNLFRRPLRTFLTIFGIAVALFLFCFLEGVLCAFNAGAAMASASRLVVQHKEAITFTLPMSYGSRIEHIQGVTGVAGIVWFGGPYDEPTPGEARHEQFFPQFATEFGNYLPLVPEITIPPDQLRALLADPAGCLLGDKIAERIHKKVGDRLVLQGSIYSKPDNRPWEFTVRALYSSDSPTFDRTLMYFHWKYLDEAREFSKGSTSFYVVGINDPNHYQEISSAIDARFQNSPFETRTMTEKAFNMNFVSMMGNLQLLLRSIGSAVVLTMLLVSANTMMMSARERTREMGILKAMGFSDRYIFFLLVGEALVLSVVGAILGGGGAFILINLFHFNPKPDFFPVFYLSTDALLASFAIAVLTGVLSGLLPAVAGMRLKATDALRSI